MRTGAVAMPESHESGGSSPVLADHKASRSAGVRSTTKSQPWLKPALGARMAASRQARTIASATERWGS